MNEEHLYTLSDKLLGLIDSEIESMDEWLTNMGEDELAIFHRICNKNPEERSDEENDTICKYSLALYAREIGLEEFAITPDFLSDLTGGFCANILIEPMRRSKLIETDGPLVLYKDYKFKLTEEGKNKIGKKHKKD